MPTAELMDRRHGVADEATREEIQDGRRAERPAEDDYRWEMQTSEYLDKSPFFFFLTTGDHCLVKKRTLVLLRWAEKSLKIQLN